MRSNPRGRTSQAASTRVLGLLVFEVGELIHDWRNPHSVYYGSCTLHIADFLPKEGRALSLGCGTGDCELRLRREGLKIVCTDFSKGMLSKAVENHRSSEKGSVAFLLCEASRLPFKESCFDLVYARGALLSYVANPCTVLAESFRVLVPGGSAAFDAMNWGFAARGGGPSALSRDEAGKVKLFAWRNVDKKQMKEWIEVDPSGRIAALLGSNKSIKLHYASERMREDFDKSAGIEGVKAIKAVFKNGSADAPACCILDPAEFEGALEKQAIAKTGQVAYFFEPEDLEGLFAGAGLQILRVAPLGNLYHTVSGVQDVERIVAMEKARWANLDMGKAMHTFIAGRKPRLPQP